MPSWNELLTEFNVTPPQERGGWIQNRQIAALQEIGRLRGGRNVLFYSSAFLQKPQVAPMYTQITHEDMNGLMAVIYGMAYDRDLTLILHTPGGVTNAAESIVAYLRSKFRNIEVIVPTFAMSAGTMISLAADRIWMGRQSQLGPIDPQFVMANGALSARAVVDQFERAKKEIVADRATAHVWAPILQAVGPALLQEAQNALEYGERMVAEWLEQYMFRGRETAAEEAARAAHHFNDASMHKSHGRRIGRDEARTQGVVIEDLEQNQELQDQVLTAYHLATITFEQSPATKVLISDSSRVWLKNWVPPQMPLQVARPISLDLQTVG